jgi:methylenetetrahydrofolate reductase (NADPH)
MDSERAGAAPPLRTANAAPADLKAKLVEFVREASVEISPHERDLLDALAGRLPPGTAVYVTHTPKSSVSEVADIACEVEDRGFRAFPHIAARRIPSEATFDSALGRLKDHGVTRAMLIAGDVATPVGLYDSTLDILRSGRLAAAGIGTLGVAGHPEGHNRVESTLLWTSLREKQAYAESTGARLHIVSQFGFDPQALVRWDRELGDHGITLPVHAGIAGPASLKTLIRYAVLCGIGASLNALKSNLGAVASAKSLVTSADEMLFRIVQAREGALVERIVKPHFFAFGGLLETARWLDALRAGRFDIDEPAGKLVIHH